MKLAQRFGWADADAFLDSLDPAQVDEWAALERIDPQDSERLHAQLVAIGGALLYELQIVNWRLLHFMLSEEDLQSLPKPQLPDEALLDPLSPRNAARKSRSSAHRDVTDETEWSSPAVAAAALRVAVRGR